MARNSHLKSGALIFILAFSLAYKANAEDLMGIYRLVEKSDPRFVIGRGTVDIGEARERQAFGQLLPQASFSSSLSSTERTVEEFDQFNQFGGERYAVSVQQAVFNMESYHSWQRAKTVTDQFAFEYDDTVAKVQLDTIERYFELLKAEDELRLLAEEKEDTRKKVQQTQSLFDKQLVRVNELLEVKASLDLIESEEIDARQVRDIARESLTELTGQPVEFVNTLKNNLGFDAPETELDQFIDIAMQENPALRALSTEVSAVRRDIKSKRAQHLPTVDLQLSKQETDIGFDNTQSPRSESEVISLNINVPLYSGGTTSARVKESAKQLVVTQAELDKTRREVIKDLKDMYIGTRATLRRIQATNKAVESAEKSLEASERSFELGMTTISDLLDVQRALLEARRRNQQSRYDFIITKARLAYLSGTLDETIMADINNWLK